MSLLKKINIERYKSILSDSLNVDGYGMHLFTGMNGVGKTAILESVASCNSETIDYNNAKINRFLQDGNSINIAYSYEVKGDDISLEMESITLTEEFRKNIYLLYIKKEKIITSSNNSDVFYCCVKFKDTNKNFITSYDVETKKVTYDLVDTIDKLETVKQEQINELGKSVYNNLKFIRSSNFLISNMSNKFLSGQETINLEDEYLIKLLEIAGVENPKNFLDINKRYKKQVILNKIDYFLNNNIQKYFRDTSLKVKSKINNSNDILFEIFIGDVEFKKSEFSSGQNVIIDILLSDVFTTERSSNNIIIIDEPENSLHPLAIKEVRKILLDISKTNYVFIATHSPFMIDYKQDNEDPDYNVHYYEVTNNNDEGTKVRELKEDESFNDNNLFESAFGLSFMSELLASNILVLEGVTDVKIFKKYLKNKGIQVLGGEGKEVNRWIEFLINRVNSNSKIIGLFDADGDGKQYYAKNKDKIDSFILTDVDDSLIDNAQLEDIYDLEYIKQEIQKYKKDYVYDDGKSVWENVKNAELNSEKKCLKESWNEYFLTNNSSKIESFVKKVEEKFNQ